MRNYVGGEGWNMEIIKNELYFINPWFSWNYELDELICYESIRDEIMYIWSPNINGEMVLRLASNPIYMNDDYKYEWCVNKEMYMKIAHFVIVNVKYLW